MTKTPVARDIMKTGLVTVGPDDSILAAAQKLVKHRLSGAPVVDREHRLLGVVSERDCLLQGSPNDRARDRRDDDCRGVRAASGASAVGGGDWQAVGSGLSRGSIEGSGGMGRSRRTGSSGSAELLEPNPRRERFAAGVMLPTAQ